MLGPVEGVLADKLGPRRMVLFGFLILGAGFILFSLIQNAPAFYLTYLLIAVGAGLGGFIPIMAAVNNWFVRRRSTAIAIAQTGTNVGGLLVPALAWGIATHGWRATAVGLGIFVLALAIPVSRAIRNRPEEYGQRPDGLPATVATTQAPLQITRPAADFTLGQAIRTPAFWYITASHGFSALVSTTMAVHVIPFFTDVGLSLELAGTVVATYTAVGIAFQLVGGFLGDRVSKRVGICLFTAIQASALLVAALAQNAYLAFLFAVLYGIGFGGRNPLLIAIRGDYFGRKAFATILGASMLPMNILMIAGPLATGYLFDSLGSYTVPFIGMAALNIVGAALILLARRPTPAPTVGKRAAGAAP